MTNQTRKRRCGLYTCLTLLAVVLGNSAMAQGVGTAPSWAQSISPGSWASISQNEIGDVDPRYDPAANPNYPGVPPWNGNNGHACVIDCWNGGAFATRLGSKGSLIAWGGGHQGYYGNEVYAFDMATRLWTRLSNPYAGSPNFPVNDGIWPDGSPVVPHTYGMVGYHSATNSFVSVQTEWSNAGGTVSPVPVLFDLATKSWRRGPHAPQHIQYGGWAVYDSTRDAWWMEGGDSGGAFGKYVMNGNGTAGTWTTYPAHFSALDAMAAYDPIHDIIVITNFRTGSDIFAVDPKNPTNSPTRLTQGGSPPGRQGRHGWEWSTARGAFIYYRSGSDVYEVKLSGSDWRTGTWTWTRLTTSSSVAPQDPSPGVYSRFRVAAYDDMEVAVVVNSTTGPVYAFRMPGGSAPRPNPPTLSAQ